MGSVERGCRDFLVPPPMRRFRLPGSRADRDLAHWHESSARDVAQNT
jgi:hypothetical protein